MPPFRPADLDRAFALAAEEVDAGTAPWVVLGVAGADGSVRLEAVGSVDGRPVATDAVCAIASITKPIVATAVMQLVAEGRIVLNVPIGRYLPEVAAAGGRPVTAWHVLSHTSGMDDLDIQGLLARGASPAEVVPLLLAAPRFADPGVTFRYATSPFELLGALIERQDGRPLAAALQARVLDPLGMTDTTFEPRGDLTDRRILPLAPASMGGGVVPASMADAFVGLTKSGGGLWSTAPDLLAFGRTMLRGGELDGHRLLPRAFVRLMTRETTVDGIGRTGDPLTANHYALGWGKPGTWTAASPEAFGHGGVSGTRLWIDPAYDLVVVYLTGAWDYPTEPIDAVMAAVYAALP